MYDTLTMNVTTSVTTMIYFHKSFTIEHHCSVNLSQLTVPSRGIREFIVESSYAWFAAIHMAASIQSV